ncbi:MAG: efflux transporter outer membrane subunit [Kofleriaceae bacterium]|nr:efflux transporter outer membrane subunit [Kofleriaceae bacterium]
MRTPRLACAAIALVVGCDPAPPYRVPSTPRPAGARYKEAYGTWKVASPADTIPRGAWWTMFREPELDALEARLDFSNQTIRVAFHNYMAARAQIRAAQSQYAPVVTADPAVTWFRRSGTFAGVTTTSGAPTTGLSAGTTGTSAGVGGGRIVSYSLPLEASWVPDLFGRVKNAVRRSQYQAQLSAADLESTRLLAQTQLAEVYFQIRGQDALIQVLEGVVATYTEIVALTRSRFQQGLDTEATYVESQLTLETARVQLTTAAILRAQYEHAIATLLGVPATSFSLPRRALIAQPPAIPTGTPSELLERRPDIAAAERQMASANAAIGIARAAYFPVLTLTGNAGLLSSSLDQLFTWPSRVWSVGAALAETLFDGGRRSAIVDQTMATYDATVAAYRQTVLVAFQQVEDFLAQTRILAEAREQQRAVVAFAQKALALTRDRYTNGIDPYVNVMIQQTALLAAEQTLVNLEVQHMTGAVLLVQALGGGWDRSQLPTEAEVSRPARARESVR